MNTAGTVGANLWRGVIEIIRMDRGGIGEGGESRRGGKRRADNRAALSAEPLSRNIFPHNPGRIGNGTGKCQAQRIENMNFRALDNRAGYIRGQNRCGKISNSRRHVAPCITAHAGLPFCLFRNILVCRYYKQPQPDRTYLELL